MATETNEATLNSNQNDEFKNKLQQIKADLNVESTEHMLDFAMRVTPLGVGKAGATTIKELGPKVVEAVKHLPETIQAAKQPYHKLFKTHYH